LRRFQNGRFFAFFNLVISLVSTFRLCCSLFLFFLCVLFMINVGIGWIGPNPNPIPHISLPFTKMHPNLLLTLLSPFSSLSFLNGWDDRILDSYRYAVHETNLGQHNHVNHIVPVSVWILAILRRHRHRRPTSTINITRISYLIARFHIAGLHRTHHTDPLVSSSCLANKITKSDVSVPVPVPESRHHHRHRHLHVRNSPFLLNSTSYALFDPNSTWPRIHASCVVHRIMIPFPPYLPKITRTPYYRGRLFLFPASSFPFFLLVGSVIERYRLANIRRWRLRACLSPFVDYFLSF
jgi:hypothetical protein